jgi:DnaJ homolog subfamily A member 2
MVKETGLYEILGVAIDVDENGLKRSYRKLALKFHPDKNQGDEEAADKFKQIGHAYEILSDAEKRAIYDRHGMKGLEQGGGGGGGGQDASDIFSMFFGGGRREKGEPKPKDIIHELPVTLEDMYLGKTKKIAATRDRFCDQCDAQGVKPGAQREHCNDCNGRGVRIVMQQVFPGMVQRGQIPCSACEGQGQRVRASDLCNKCQGKKVAKEKKILEVHVEKGMKKGDHIRFTGEGDQIPGVKLSGDIILIIGQKPHDLFKRVGSHLLINHTISLQEALCGFELPIEHLDKRVVVAKLSPGVVIDPNFAWTMHREGMPVPNTGGVERGNLVVHFDIEFPAALTASARAVVASSLGYAGAPSAPSGAQQATLSAYAPQGRRGQRRQMHRGDDDDDDEGHHHHGHGHGGGGGGGQPQCQQM